MAQQFVTGSINVGAFTTGNADALSHDVTELYNTGLAIQGTANAALPTLIPASLSASVQDIYPSPSPADRTAIIGPAVGGLNAWEGQICQEPNGFFSNGFWHQLYTGGNAAVQSIGYAYASTPTGPWTRPNPNPVIGNGNGGLTAGQYCAHTGMLIENNTIYIITSVSPNTGGCLLFSAPLNFSVLTGPTFSLVGTIFTRPGSTLSWGNFGLCRNPFAPGYALFYEILLGTGAYCIGVATSTATSLNGAPTFTNVSTTIAALISNMTYYGASAILTGGPCVVIENGAIVLYYHGGPQPGSAPTDVFRAVCTDPTFVAWKNWDNGYPAMRRNSKYEIDQVADTSLAQGPGGDWWIFNTAYDNKSALSNVEATPCYRSTTVTSNGSKTYLNKTSDIFADRGYNATILPSALTTTYSPLNADSLLFNLANSSVTVTLPKASFGSYVRIGAFNGAASHAVVVNPNGTDVLLGGDRVLPGQQVTYRADNIGFWNADCPPMGKPIQYSAPTTGFSVTMIRGSQRTILDPAGTLASGTLVFPNSPQEGEEALICASQTITSMTFTPGSGDTIGGAPAGLTANVGVGFIYRQVLAKWFRLY